MFWGIAFKISFVFAGVGHMVDTSATQRCLGARACTELNHFLARFDNPVGFALAKGIVAGGTEIVIFDFTKENKPLGIIVNSAIGSGFTYLGYRNWKIANVRD